MLTKIYKICHYFAMITCIVGIIASLIGELVAKTFQSLLFSFYVSLLFFSLLGVLRVKELWSLKRDKHGS